MTAHQLWVNSDPVGYQKLLEEDPDHLKMMEQGWSWIVLVGGPKDGGRVYFAGSPNWEVRYVDPSVDPEKYKPGDLEHLYVLSKDGEGQAVYKYKGEYRAHPE